MFFNVKFMKYKCRSSISNENIVTELRYTQCVSIKVTLDFKDLVLKNVKYLISNS